MTSKTRSIRTRQQERDTLSKGVFFIDGACRRRAFDAVVVEIDRFTPGAQLRTIVLHTGSVDRKSEDIARCQRLCRRLRAVGVRFNTRIEGDRDCDGLFGTMFAHRIARAA